MLRNWVHRGGPWTGSKEVVHGPGPKGWSMDLGSIFCIRFQNGIARRNPSDIVSSFEGSFLKVDKLIVNVQIYKGRETKDLIHYGAIM